MKVEDYVSGVLGHRTHADGFPAHLVLPDKLVVAFSAFYAAGEQNAREYGCNLVYEEQYDELLLSQRYEGDQNSCPIRTMIHFENCADVHCHPADSIGDVGGHSPHSMEDFLSFSEQLHKPLFIRFVVSGDRIFAAVYRKGYTIYDAQGIDAVRGDLAYAIQQYFNARCPVGEDERLEAVMKAQQDAFDHGKDQNEAAVQLIFAYKRRTPGLGEFTASETMKACRKVASDRRFGFYERVDTYRLARID